MAQSYPWRLILLFPMFLYSGGISRRRSHSRKPFLFVPGTVCRDQHMAFCLVIFFRDRICGVRNASFYSGRKMYFCLPYHLPVVVALQWFLILVGIPSSEILHSLEPQSSVLLWYQQLSCTKNSICWKDHFFKKNCSSDLWREPSFFFDFFHATVSMTVNHLSSPDMGTMEGSKKPWRSSTKYLRAKAGIRQWDIVIL